MFAADEIRSWLDAPGSCIPAGNPILPADIKGRLAIAEGPGLLLRVVATRPQHEDIFPDIVRRARSAKPRFDSLPGRASGVGRAGPGDSGVYRQATHLKAFISPEILGVFSDEVLAPYFKFPPVPKKRHGNIFYVLYEPMFGTGGVKVRVGVAGHA